MAKGPMFRRIYRRLVADLAVSLPLGARLLDVGTGPGYLLAHLAQDRADLRLFGLDLNYGMVRRAGGQDSGASTQKLPTLLVGSALALPFPNQTFHRILATFSLHNWRQPAQGIKEIVRVLKKGGRAYIYEMNRQASIQDLRRFAQDEKLPFPLIYLGFKGLSLYHALRAQDFAATFKHAAVTDWHLQPAHHLFWQAEVRG